MQNVKEDMAMTALGHPILAFEGELYAVGPLELLKSLDNRHLL